MLYRIQDPVSNTETRLDSSSKEVKVIHWPERALGGSAADPFNAFLGPLGEDLEKFGSMTIEGVVAEGHVAPTL
jgi:hypothetical protein